MVDAKVRLEAVEAQKIAIEARLAGLRNELVEIGDLEPERDRLEQRLHDRV
jgi:outer membrane protein TolC